MIFVILLQSQTANTEDNTSSQRTVSSIFKAIPRIFFALEQMNKKTDYDEDYMGEILGSVFEKQHVDIG